MATDPKCPRCGLAMPVLFQVQRYCPDGCDKLPPGPPCPKCGSTVTDEFVVETFFGPPTVKMHCWPCGAMWEHGQKPETD